MTTIQSLFVTRQLLRQAMPNASDRIILAFEQLFLNNNEQISVAPPTPSDGTSALSMVGGLSTQIADVESGLSAVSDAANNALAAASNIQQAEFVQMPDPYAINQTTDQLLQMPDPYSVAMLSDDLVYSFTPVVIGSTTAGVGTYTKQYGRAQRIDSRVYFTAEITWTAHTGTGNMLITTGLQLPLNRMACTIVASNLTYPTGQLAAIIETSSIVSVYQQATAAALASLPIDTAATIYLTGFYEV